MKYFFIALLTLLTGTAAFAQKNDSSIVQKPKTEQSKKTEEPKKKNWSKIDLSHRANDHFMVQIGYDNWAGTPDTIHIGGFNRSFNFYFMLDFPFKTDPRLSVGAGLGIGSSNIFFKNQEVLVGDQNNSTLAFPDETGANHYKKYKLVTTYLEVPLELRYALDPENTNKSWKFAVGTKIGAMLSAYTRAKDLQNEANQTINNVIIKESSKKYFNAFRAVATARISKGVFGIFGQFQLTPLIKGSYGAPVYPFTIGLCFSGL
ncbi:MAG: outer membrane beta-barrel protein [Bacteroidetes bacterium]|nr:outer membrane beta-barrel protein [Bacteroidota bacterium]